LPTILTRMIFDESSFMVEYFYEFPSLDATKKSCHQERKIHENIHEIEINSYKKLNITAANVFQAINDGY